MFPDMQAGNWLVLEPPDYVPDYVPELRRWHVFRSGRRCNNRQLVLPTSCTGAFWMVYARHQPTREEWAVPVHYTVVHGTTLLRDKFNV